MPYDPTGGYTLAGSDYAGSSLIAPFTQAEQFTVAGSGTEAVTEIDLGVTNGFPNESCSGNPPECLNTFFASIWTEVSGSPGKQITGAYWSLTSTPNGSCCALVSVTGITGVALTGGKQYFMVLGPSDPGSLNTWYNAVPSQRVFGDLQYSTDFGTTWTDEGPSALSAFAVLGTPEPSALALLGTAIAVLGLIKLRHSHP